MFQGYSIYPAKRNRMHELSNWLLCLERVQLCTLEYLGEYLSSSTAVCTKFIIIYLSAHVSHGLQFAPEVLYNQVLSKVRNYHRRATS